MVSFVSGRRSVVGASLFVAILLSCGAARAQSEPAASAESEAERVLGSIQWTQGPGKVEIGSLAQLEVPAGFRFTGPDGARKMLELMRNPTDGSELGLLTTDDLAWFLLFDFSDIGYVKDAAKEKLDAEAMLASIREGNEAGNEARRERGWPPITIVGWHTPPFYNAQTNNLEWCIKGESEGRPIVNYNTRILGRGGVMSANLMVNPTKLDDTLPVLKQVLAGYSFVEGKRYSEFRAGDKVAKYGLTALVVGGAVGVAAKAGLLAKLAASLGKAWKFVILALVALAAGIKKLFVRRKPEPEAPRPDPQGEPPPQG